ncbi:MAG TPA: DMT family transporter [Nocardioidaceae bacterium]|nr:DMT family transporter [Nocardioidaceae bacterium]
MYAVFVAASLVAGCLLAVQATVNQQLNKAVGTPFGASTVQLSVAALVLGVLAAATGMRGALTAVPDVSPGWLFLGGLASPLYITAGIVLFPRLGALTAVGLFVTGQVFASLVLDILGWLAVPQERVSLGMVLGATAVVAGITVVVRAQQQAAQPVPVPVGASGAASRSAAAGTPSSAARSTSRRLTGWVVLGLSAGAALPVQGAVNAQLQRQVNSPLAVGTISFVVATLAIAAVLAALLTLDRTSTPQLRPLRSMPWWGWLGGFCAAAYVTATFLLIPTIGAAVTVALTVAGQQLASAAIDQYGWLGMPHRSVTWQRGLGLALLLAGSVLVQLV